MKNTYINNRFFDDSTWFEIQNQTIEELYDGAFSANDRKRFDAVVATLKKIAKNRAHYHGLREAKPEDDFVNELSMALGVTKYAKPQINAINRTPDFTFTREENISYMNLYKRSKADFWAKTDLLVEVKPVGFLLEDYDPDTKRLWVDKCAWLQKTTAVKIGLLTNFTTWYFVRNSSEDEAKFLALFLDGAVEGEGGDLNAFSEEVLERNAIAIAKMLFVSINDDLRSRIFSDFESTDNEELDIADSLLPRFIDSISLLASDLPPGEDGKVVREAMTQIFCIWSTLSSSEVLGMDLQINLGLGRDYLGCLQSYLLNPSADSKIKLDKIGQVVRTNAGELFNYIRNTLPEKTREHFKKLRSEIDLDTIHKIAFLLFIETEKNKISVRGTHRLGASSISTVFEGTLSFNIEKLSRAENRTRAYWHSSLGVAPDVAEIAIKGLLLVEPKKEDDKKRKKLGAYFTPTPLCDFLIERLNFEIVDKKYPVAMDPTCGTGQFLLAYLRKLTNSLHLEADYLPKAIIGNDIEPMAVFVSAYRINSYLSRVVGKMNGKELALYCGDFTSPEKFNDLKGLLPKINHVIGNPPFGAEGNSNEQFSNTWQSCLFHSTRLGGAISLGLVLPASFATTSEHGTKILRNEIIAKSCRFHAVAFDTRPSPIFPDNDQRPIFLTFDFGVESKGKQKEILSGGYRRHLKAKSIEQSLNDIQWQPVLLKDTLDVFPLPADENEGKLIRVAFDAIQKTVEKENTSDAKKSSTKSKVSSKTYPVSVLSYGRYNLNAIMGLAPVGGGKKWKTYHFSDEEAAARMVVGLNSNLGWSLFRTLTNGLDFHSRLVDILGAMPAGVGKNSSCIKIAKSFSDKMRKSYQKEGTFELAGRYDDFTALNKAAESAFGLKKLGISADKCSDVERIRVLKDAA